MRPSEERKSKFEVSMEELNPFGEMGPSSPMPSIEELNPFSGSAPPQPGQPATKRLPQGIGALQSGGFDDDMPLPSIDELDAFANRPLPPPPAPKGGDPFAQADFGDPDPFASSKKMVGPPDPFGSQGPPSGLTPAGVPVGGVADSDSIKNKAKKVKKKTVTKKSNTSTLLLVLIVASVLLVVLLVVLLNSIL